MGFPSGGFLCFTMGLFVVSYGWESLVAVFCCFEWFVNTLWVYCWVVLCAFTYVESITIVLGMVRGVLGFVV